ncbi:MAG TPA: Thivi_2564 family membrane protein [Chthoniobacterales bacterium]|nr:Thivi_2564 family membrane protein [Chthoniobacterales bacterium]
MDLLHVVLILIVVGVLLYLVNRFVPMDAKIKLILNWVVVIAVVVWLLSLFGLFSYLSGVPVGRPRHY